MTLTRRLQLVGCSTEDRWMATAVKVAFATSDMQQVNQHFGAAEAFAIYAVDRDHACFVEASEFGGPETEVHLDGLGNGTSGHNEDKLSDKIDVLEDCIAIYSQAVGASAIRQLKARGIQPVKVPHGAEISELLTALQDELKQGPSSWLAKAIASAMPADSSRFDVMEAEGWEE